MEKNIYKFDVDITIQKNSTKLSEADSRYFEKMVKSLDDMEKQQTKITAEIKNLGEIIKKKK